MNKKIGAQLYTLRDTCQTAEDMDKTFFKLKQIGYKAIQISGVGPIPAEQIKELADKYNLEIYCTHMGFEDYRHKLDKVIRDHKVLGCSIAGLGMMPREYWDNVLEFAGIINPIAAELKKEGLQFAYHNHAFEFVKVDGKYKMDYLLENTDPENVKMIVDVYWVAVAGIDPAEYLEKLGERVAAIHFKDLTLDGNQPFYAEIMEGNLNWDKIIAACEKIDADYILVEQDNWRREPIESIEISYKNLLTKGFY